MLHRIYNIPLCCFGQLSTTNNGYSLYLRFVACHLSKWIKSLWLILIPQLASTLWGGTGKNAVPLSNNNKKSMTFVDTENESADEDYFQPQKRLQTYSSHSQYDWSLWEDMVSCTLKQFHSFITGAELEDRILYQNPIPSNLPPPLPLDQFLKGVLEENHKYSQTQQKLSPMSQKMF